MIRSRGVSLVSAAVLLGFALVASASAQTATQTPDPALATVFAGASLPQADLMPKPTLKCGKTCLTALHFTTPTISGSGANCTAAQSSLNSQLTNIAANDCVPEFDGLCNFGVHATSCKMIGSGAYQVQGYATFNCSVINC
jgi:hypothetical protein